MEPNRNQLYFIQLDPNLATDLSNTQVVPVHFLENVLDQEILLPLTQQSHVDNTKFMTSTKRDVSTSETVNSMSYSMLNETANIPTYNQYVVNTTNMGNDYYRSNLNDLSTEVNRNNQYDASQEYLNKNVDIYLNKYVSYENPNVMVTNDSNMINESDNQKSTKVIKKHANDLAENKAKPQNYIHISDTKVPPRAIAVLPSILQIRGNESSIVNISPKRTLSGRRRFGPVQGIPKKLTISEAEQLKLNSKSPLFLLKGDDGYITQLDVSDMDKSNWIGLLPLGDQSTANIWLYEEDNKLYGITTEPVLARRPLKIGYSKKYVEDHKLPLGVPVLDLETVLITNPKQWWCNECHRVLPSANLLQRHVDVYHKECVLRYRRSIHRCTNCRRTFSRLFTLRRHLKLHCLKKPENKPEITAEEPPPPPDINIPLNNEDNRIPSDESFNNYSNGLDFSTNLFDTDRISNLDISSHSRTDGDFNPYSLGLKDDVLNRDLGTSKQVENIKEENILETCKYCKAVVVKENKRKHLSTCPSRILTCSCGLSFTHKKRLALHVHKKHSTESAKDNKDDNKDTKNSYKCEHCELSFKRRGMLSNHSWRIHKQVSRAPVQRRERQYPCVGCHKLYRSAAKRDRHALLHHPGAEKVRGLCIETGVRAVEAAACAACPRQYATRAKLLQHVRNQHPHLAPALKVTAKTKTDSNKVTQPTEKQNSTSLHTFVYY